MGVDISRLGPAAQAQIYEHLKARKTMAPAKPSKYHAEKAQRVMPNGTVRTFDSQKEARRYDELALLLAAGAIRDLRLQQSFTLVEGYVTAEGETVRPIVYKADFVYEVVPSEGRFTGGRWAKPVQVVEDVKGVQTEGYKLKKKLMRERFGVQIREV